MKTKLTLLLLASLSYFKIAAQTSVSQNFEGAGTYGFTGGTINTETSRGGTRSLRLGRSDGSTSCGVPTDNIDVVFDPIFLIGSSCPGVFTFYHSVRASSGSGCGSGRGLDAREGFAVYVKLNGSASWTLLNSFSGFTNLSWGWATNAVNGSSQCGTTPFPNPFVYNVPAGSTSAQFKIITIKGAGTDCVDFTSQASAATGSNYDRGDEGFFIDDVSFSTTSPCILPIQLLDFYGLKNKNNNELYWKVAVEENIDYYNLEKSNDGINFSELGFIPPSNSNSSTLSYSYIDEMPFKDITYYRLKTKENNGSINIHKIISLDRNETNWNYVHYQELNNLIVEFKNNIPKNASIELYDVTGKQIVSQTIENSKNIINTENLAGGFYYIKLNTNYKTEFFKILISK